MQDQPVIVTPRRVGARRWKGRLVASVPFDPNASSVTKVNVPWPGAPASPATGAPEGSIALEAGQSLVLPEGSGVSPWPVAVQTANLQVVAHG